MNERLEAIIKCSEKNLNAVNGKEKRVNTRGIGTSTLLVCPSVLRFIQEHSRVVTKRPTTQFFLLTSR